MKTLLWLKAFLELLGGCGTPAPAGAAWIERGWVRGLWWGALLVVIILFCGQTSKFIYIDF